MRTQTEIEARIRDILAEEWQRRMQESRTKLPHLCIYNHRQPLDLDKVKAGEINPGYNRLDRAHLPVVQSIGLCMYGAGSADWPGTICDEPIDAHRCPLFTRKEAGTETWDQFVADVNNPDWSREHRPDLSSLLWALDATASPGLFYFPAWFLVLIRLLTSKPRPPVLDVPANLLPPFQPDGASPPSLVE